MKLTTIHKLHAANFLTGLVFWYPIEKLFMQSIGIDAVGVGAAAAMLLIVTLLLDVPSGVLADKWKRVYVLVIGLIALTLSSLILGLSTNLAMYLAGTALYGLYIVMTSGTLQAIMYDALKEQGQEADYDKHQGRSFGLFLTAIGFSSLAGGFIGQFIGLQQAYLFSLIPSILAVLVLLSIREPVYHKELVENHFGRHVASAARVVIHNKPALFLSLLFIVASSLRFAQNDFGGLYYIGLGLSALGMGVANSGKWIAGAIGQFAAASIGKERAFRLIPVLFVAFTLFSFVPDTWGLVFFYISAGLFAVILTQTEAVLQGTIPSSLRATIISLLSFSVSALMIPASLIFGWIAREYDIFRAYQVLAATGIVYLVFWLVYARRKLA